jgi:Mrp family chromosome partitioning ATPase
MTRRNQSSKDNMRKAQMEQQDRDIKENLQHIKNKILVMSGKGGVGKT